jgi:hypothetical protein
VHVSVSACVRLLPVEVDCHDYLIWLFAGDRISVSQLLNGDKVQLNAIVAKYDSCK